MSQITVTVPAVTVYGGTVPDRSAGQTEEQFANNVYPYLGYFNTTFTPENQAVITALNTFKTQANALATDVNTDATTATTQAGIATTQAGLADTARIAAQAAQTAAEGALDAFDDRYLGSKTVAPTLDNDGNALISGALYWNSSSNQMFVYDLAITTWISLSFTPTSHTSLTNLANDDHTQYHNDARGDTRYYTKSANDTLLNAKSNLSGATFTGAINTARATVASHATTADIWGALGNQINWTGTATTTAFPNAPQAGAERTLICDGACSFTAGANMLIDGVTSGQSVTCAVGDTVIVRAISTTQFKLTRLKADGTATSSDSAMILISTIVANNAATVDFTLNSTYDDYLVIGSGVYCSSGTADLLLEQKVGASYIQSGYYWHTSRLTFSSGTYASDVATSSTSILIVSNLITTASASDGAIISMKLLGINNSSYKTIMADGVAPNEGAFSARGGSFQSSALTGIRIKPSGNNMYGIFKLYGIKK